MASYRDRCQKKSIELVTLKKIYLDTKYWLILRDVHRGETSDSAKLRLYELVLDLAKSGKAIFPFSESHFEEFLKQTDSESLESTLSLIYLLSRNTAIRPYRERVVVEFELMLRFLLNPEGVEGSYLESCSQNVWTCVAYAWGKFAVVDSGEQNRRYDNQVQDVLFDNQLALQIYLEHLRHLSGFGKSYPDPTQKILDRRKSKSTKLKEILVDELKSEVIENKSKILNAISNTLEDYTAEQANFLMNILFERKATNTLDDFIPSMNTFSTICATWIISQDKNVAVNDYFDMHHASSALPYFDMFLTEKSLLDAIKRAIPKYLPFQKVHVYADILSAIKALEVMSETLGE